jgi:hypothetical protein
MIDANAEHSAGLAPIGDAGGGTQLGKRYTADTDSGLELLVTKPGSCGLTVNGAPVTMKEAKPLPSSD